MYKFFLVIILVLFIGTGCNKDKVGTTPALKFKSLSPSVMTANDVLVLEFSFTDKEGDLDSLFRTIHVLNGNQRGSGSEYKLVKYAIPAFNAKNKGDIVMQYARKLDFNLPLLDEPLTVQNDTIRFQLVVKDKAGHYSDTLTTPQMVIVK